MPTALSAADLPGLLRPGMTVYAPGAAGESAVLTDALSAAPDAAAGVRFVGVWLPGYNAFDYAGLHPDARATAFFPTPALRPSFEAGRAAYHPLTYHGIYRYLRTVPTIDLALLHVAPPDDDGRCSLGIACDFTPAVLGRAARTLAHVNPNMPRTRGMADVAYDDLDYVIEAEGPVAGADAAPDALFATIGERLAERIPDGATLEVGIGGVQSVLTAMAGKRDLRIHSGAITDPVRRLAETGAIGAADGAITTGIAWGGPELQRFCAADRRVGFAPVGHTHDPATLRAIDRFVAINAVIEVDLFGQANAEFVGGRQVSGGGGLVDFARGAQGSPGGKAIVALASAARGGAISRIVPRLAPDATEEVEAVAFLRELASELAKDDVVVVNCSGRGDKDMGTIARYM